MSGIIWHDPDQALRPSISSHSCRAELMMPGVKARHVAAAVHNPYIAFERLLVEADMHIVH